MTTNYVNTVGFYTMEFGEAQRHVRQNNWQIDGKNKLRRFFLRNNWQRDIIGIDVSSGGAKGGVFFLEADTLKKQALKKAVGDAERARAIWDELVAEGFITRQGIKTAKGKGVGQPDWLQGSLLRLKLAAPEQQTIGKLLGTPNPQRQFVVKGTEEPGRVLFAEYVLSRIGMAKVPKSLVLTVDPARPATHANPSAGMIMLDVLSDPQKRSKRVDQARFDECMQNLVGNRQDPETYASFLVLQKQLSGAPWPSDEYVREEIEKFLVKHKLVVMAASLRSDAKLGALSRDDLASVLNGLDRCKCLIGSVVPLSYAKSLIDLEQLDLSDAGRKLTLAEMAALDKILAESRQRLTRYNLDFFSASSPKSRWDCLDKALATVSNDDPLKQAFLEVRRRQGIYMALVRNMVSDPDRMYSLGRTLFADLPIGMGDRLEHLNHGNFFFTSARSRVAAGKLPKPIACIDNDAFLFTYLPYEDQPHKQGFRGIRDYVEKLFARTAELWPAGKKPPAGYNFASSAAIFRMDVDVWFDQIFAGTIVSSLMPECVCNQLGNEFYVPGDAQNGFAQSKQLPAWTTAKLHVKRGFCEALEDFQKSKLNEYRNVYDNLRQRYGVSPNFDFLAFKVRFLYFKLATIDKKTWTVTMPGPTSKQWQTFRNERIAILQQVYADQALSPLIREALDEPQAARIIASTDSAGGAEALAAILKNLAIGEQEKLLPSPFGAGSGWDASGTKPMDLSFGGMPRNDREKVRLYWQTLGPTLRRRVNVAICAILAEFLANAQKSSQNEMALTPTSAASDIVKHSAYWRATAAAVEFSEAKLGIQDPDKTAGKARKRLWEQYKLDRF